MWLLEQTNAVHYPIWLKIVLFIRLVLPLFVRILEGNYWLGQFWYEYPLTLAQIGFFYVVYRYNLFFLYAGVIDFKRKIFFQKILKSMISVEKDKSFVFSSFFPTINIC